MTLSLCLLFVFLLALHIIVTRNLLVIIIMLFIFFSGGLKKLYN